MTPLASRLSPLALLAFLVGSAGAQHVLTTITTGLGPTAAIYDSIDRKVFVSNRGSATVSVIDPNSNIVTATIPVGEGPNAMCWSKTSNKLFVACAPVNGNGWVYVIDAATNQVVGTVAVSLNPSALAWCESRNKVYCLNANPGGPISILGGADFDSPSHSSLIAHRSSLPSPPLSQPVTRNSQPVTDIPIIPIPGQTPKAITYNPTSDRIYVSSLAYMQLGKVWVINPTDDNIEATITCGYDAWDLEVNPTNNRVYCSNRSSNTVSVIACSTNQNINDIATAGGPYPVCWLPTNKVFIGEYWNRTVAYLHGESLSVSGRFPIPGNPGTMAYLPATQKLFVTNYLSGTVSACDARDGHESLLVTLSVGSGPLGLAVDPNLNHLYVTNSWDSTVTIIADELPTAISSPTPDPRPLTPLVTARAIPNPVRASNAVRFDVPGLEPSRLDVRDVTGRLLSTTSFAISTSSFSFCFPSPGIYYCALTGGTRSASCRVTVR